MVAADSTNNTEQEEPKQLVRDFYLVLFGVAASYFISIYFTYNSLASPNVLFEAFTSVTLKSGQMPSSDAIIRSAAVTIIAPLALVFYAHAWERHRIIIQKKPTISLALELLQALFIVLVPIGFVVAFSPAVSLNAYPASQMAERIVGASFSGIIILHFYFVRKAN
ncbi:MAG: hypothetical protein ACRECH_04605 [Nitrososphaerales archaeon]